MQINNELFELLAHALLYDTNVVLCTHGVQIARLCNETSLQITLCAVEYLH